MHTRSALISVPNPRFGFPAIFRPPMPTAQIRTRSTCLRPGESVRVRRPHTNLSSSRSSGSFPLPVDDPCAAETKGRTHRCGPRGGRDRIALAHASVRPPSTFPHVLTAIVRMHACLMRLASAHQPKPRVTRSPRSHHHDHGRLPQQDATRRWTAILRIDRHNKVVW